MKKINEKISKNHRYLWFSFYFLEFLGVLVKLEKNTFFLKIILHKRWTFEISQQKNIIKCSF